MKICFADKKLEEYLYSIIPENFVLDDELYDLETNELVRQLKTYISITKNNEKNTDTQLLIDIYEAINNFQFSLEAEGRPPKHFSTILTPVVEKTELQVLAENLRRIKTELDTTLEQIDSTNRTLICDMELALDRITKKSKGWEDTLYNLRNKLLNTDDPFTVLTDIDRIKGFISYAETLVS
jgi:hypothetical protein